MAIPVINFDEYKNNAPSQITNIEEELNDALSNTGFFIATGLGFSNARLKKVFSMSKTFFASSMKSKMRYSYLSAEENFGYQPVASENLDPGLPSDLKETFTMRNVFGSYSDDSRWPNSEFKKVMTDLFKECLGQAFFLQTILAKALDLDENFFVNVHTGENIALRLLHYPPFDTDGVEPGQLGAGAHTDYGLFTFLFQETVGGLEIIDSNGDWLPVVPKQSSVLVNSGDLLERWTNGRYRSALHRVQPAKAKGERFSIAFFVDPDSETQINVLESCIGPGRPKNFENVKAGAYIQSRLKRSHFGFDKRTNE